MSHKIDITENGTTTLLTEGKYCDRNIEVNVNIASSGGTEIEDGLISGTLSGAYRNDRVTEVGHYRFGYCANLTSIDLPNVRKMETGAIRYCENLTSVNLPLFREPSRPTGANYLLANNTALQSISLPSATAVGSYCFYQCENLTDVHLPLLASASYTFFGCTYLERIELPNLMKVGTQVFNNCFNLKTLVLPRTDGVVTLENTNAFNYCHHILGTKHALHNPQALKDGYIYVPDNLVEDYKVATNWSTYADQIKPISELEE